ncbi:MAG: hypothetical protein JWO56_2556 [Acidobacteria bacterium]|nr:hypothetical protein [Acidobacteriota bacterium]
MLRLTTLTVNAKRFILLAAAPAFILHPWMCQARLMPNDIESAAAR